MPEGTTHILRVTPADEKSVYRDVEIPSGKSLYHLAEGIVSAFDFDFDHAFGFYSGLTERTMRLGRTEIRAVRRHGESTGALSVKKTTVAKAFPKVGHKMMFLFDYGDEWLFRVEVVGLGQKVARGRYPKLIASVGSSPEQYPDMEDEE